jgi:hypothetical protein
MKSSLSVILLAIILGTCSATTTLIAGSNDDSKPQTDTLNVGGDFGKNWINNFLLQNEPPVKADPKNELWNWGSVPKGKRLVDGKLVADMPRIVWNVTGEWLGENPLTGYAVYNQSNFMYSNDSMALSPMLLSSDPWVRAQQLGMPVATPK